MKNRERLAIRAIRCWAIACLVVGSLLLLQNVLFAQNIEPSVSMDANASSLALIPMPRQVQVGKLLLLAHGLSISTPDSEPEDEFAVEDLVSTLQQRGIAARNNSTGEIKIVLLRQGMKTAETILSRMHIKFTPAMHDEGYVIVTDQDTMYDIAPTATGIYYGAQTIKQLIVGRGSQATLQGVEIRDWPAMRYRGLSDDVSRGPVPTLEFEEHKLRVLSEYKINIYSPYFETSLEYRTNPLPADPGGAMTRAEIEKLVRYAQQYHVTIVPEQESFGHLRRVLKYEIYSPVAETPLGFGLAPSQAGSIQLIKQWFTEISSMFPGPFVHIGGDEVKVGEGQSKQLVAEEGAAKVYYGFLTRIYNTLLPLNKRLIFWGDSNIAAKNPALLKTLPKGMVAVPWAYDPQPEGFEKQLRPFIDAGIETWVAPGVNNWDRVYPNNFNALRNIQGFISDGQRLGSTGLLNCVWNSDKFNEGLFNNDWYGLLFGAAAGWQVGTSSIQQFENDFGQVFHGDRTGKINQAQMELTAAQHAFQKAGFEKGATTDLFWADPWSRQGQLDSVKLLPVAHEIRLHAEHAIILAEEAKDAGPLREMDAINDMELGARRIDFIAYKFQAAQDIVDRYDQLYREQNLKRAAHSPRKKVFPILDRYKDLIQGYGLLHDLYKQAWVRENRPHSLYNVMAHYDLNMQIWMQRKNRYYETQDDFIQTGVWPKPEDVGLPAFVGKKSPVPMR